MNDSVKILVQESDFNIQDEYNQVVHNNSEDGAVVFFVGRVREMNQNHQVTGLTLEHYPEMTQKALESIVEQAKSRWTLNRVTLIHRVGPLKLEDQIVLVITSSPHREEAFESAQFLMDYLKTQAPFWKKENTVTGDRWVEANSKDQKAAERW